MSPSKSKIPARSELKIFVRSGQIIPVRLVRIFKITTETTSINVTPFLKHIRETVDTNADTDTDSVEWKKNWMKDIIHSTLKSLHKIRWRKVRILANMDKDCTTKQLITSLQIFYPIMNEYYTFAFNDDNDFEVMVTITSIVQKTTNNITSLPSNTTTTLGDNDNIQLLNDTNIVDKNVASSLLSIRNKKTSNNDNQSTNNNNNNNKESHVKAGSVINSVYVNETLPFMLEARDFESSEDDSNDDICLPTDEFQDFEDRNIHQMFSSPVHHKTNHNKEPWSEIASLKKGRREYSQLMYNATSNWYL